MSSLFLRKKIPIQNSSTCRDPGYIKHAAPREVGHGLQGLVDLRVYVINGDQFTFDRCFLCFFFRLREPRKYIIEEIISSIIYKKSNIVALAIIGR